MQSQPFPDPNQYVPRPPQQPHPSQRVTRINPRILWPVLGAVALLLCIAFVGALYRQPPPLPQRSAEAHAGYVGKAGGLGALPEGYKVTPKPPPPTQVSQAQETALPPKPELPARSAPQQHAAPAQPHKPSEAELAAKEARTSPLLFAKVQPDPQARAVAPPILPPMGEAAVGQGGGGQEGFLQRAAQVQETHLKDRLHVPESPYTVLAGTIIPAVLETGINSDLPGMLKARVREPVYDTVSGQWLLIPQGTVAIGAYDSNIVYGQERVLIAWQRLVFPNGASLQLEGMPGADLTGQAGLRDKVNHHLWPLFRAVLLSSVLSMGSRIPFGSPDGFHQNLAQEFANDFGQAANRAGQNIVNRELNRKPTIEIRPGMSFVIFVHRDMTLRPVVDNFARQK